MATPPRDGMRILWDQHVDLLSGALFMPRVNGLDIIRRLKMEKSEVKIVAISGGGTIAGCNCLELATEAGADTTLRKPLRAASVAGAVKELLPQ